MNLFEISDIVQNIIIHGSHVELCRLLQLNHTLYNMRNVLSFMKWTPIESHVPYSCFKALTTSHLKLVHDQVNDLQFIVKAYSGKLDVAFNFKHLQNLIMHFHRNDEHIKCNIQAEPNLKSLIICNGGYVNLGVFRVPSQIEKFWCSCIAYFILPSNIRKVYLGRHCTIINSMAVFSNLRKLMIDHQRDYDYFKMCPNLRSLTLVDDIFGFKCPSHIETLKLLKLQSQYQFDALPNLLHLSVNGDFTINVYPQHLTSLKIRHSYIFDSSNLPATLKYLKIDAGQVFNFNIDRLSNLQHLYLKCYDKSEKPILLDFEKHCLTYLRVAHHNTLDVENDSTLKIMHYDEFKPLPIIIPAQTILIDQLIVNKGLCGLESFLNNMRNCKTLIIRHIKCYYEGTLIIIHTPSGNVYRIKNDKKIVHVYDIYCKNLAYQLYIQGQWIQ